MASWGKGEGFGGEPSLAVFFPVLQKFQTIPLPSNTLLRNLVDELKATGFQIWKQVVWDISCTFPEKERTP